MIYPAALRDELLRESAAPRLLLLSGRAGGGETPLCDFRNVWRGRLDGGEIPDADLEHLREVVWRHTVSDPWLKGDAVAIDNHSVSHGRMPYEGPRHVVRWA